MIPESFSPSLYLFKNSSAPENATSLIYFFTSSLVIPIPLSITCRVFLELSILISICLSPKSPFISPILLKWLSFVVASVALEISSLKNIS